MMTASFSRKTSKLFLLLTAALFIHAASAVCLAGSTARYFVLHNHGRLEIKVPASWKGKVTENAKEKRNFPPAITFRAKGMEMVINPLWGTRDSGSGTSKNSQTRIVEMLQRDGNSLIARTVEKRLDLEEITGEHCRGYYFSLTAAAVKPGGFRYLTRAGMAVGDLLISISIMSDEKDSNDVKDAMAALKTMRQLR